MDLRVQSSYNLAMNGSGPFQTCGSCKQAWPDLDGFLLDPGVRLVGLFFHERLLEMSLLVFEHDCGTSISVPARRFRHLLPAPPDEEPDDPPGTVECQGHCRRLEDFGGCNQPCSNARDRDLMRLILRMKK
jgi:hypothetical protein